MTINRKKLREYLSKENKRAELIALCLTYEYNYLGFTKEQIVFLDNLSLIYYATDSHTEEDIYYAIKNNYK